MRGFNYLLLVFLGVIAGSCVDEVLCTEENTNNLKVQFVNLATGVDSVVSVLRVDAVSSNDSFPEITDTTSAYFQLPVNPGSSNTRFVFSFTNGSVKSLNVYYQTKPRIIAVDCPPEFTYTLGDTISSTFDSVQITNSELKFDTENNVKIFL